MKTSTNPKGSGRKPREIPGKHITLVLDQDLYDWLEEQRQRGGVKSEIANTAIRDFKKKFDFMLDKSKKSGHNKKAVG